MICSDFIEMTDLPHKGNHEYKAPIFAFNKQAHFYNKQLSVHKVNYRRVMHAHGHSRNKKWNVFHL